jgi:hypothetical protein
MNIFKAYAWSAGRQRSATGSPAPVSLLGSRGADLAGRGAGPGGPARTRGSDIQP